MSKRELGNITVGLIIPFIAIIGVLPFIAKIEFSILGFPILYFWVFLWFFLTTLCLCASWYFFDRPKYEDTAEKRGR
ncbi:DUF3311 domain-containing protein [Neobacillus kokaensis]|uniref:DUF3311 domain-containing protein n=1 Tax=Neobacillus kokaensis TaxID=2759023 RepID=A0ABQ3N8T1_9BACI|nr:DUF3311 domain-containing protein [Neobacillus kokaensis]GHI00552.1 hypothetical protein AM1BK_40940 [Neobacillus kokaensis]